MHHFFQFATQVIKKYWKSSVLLLMPQMVSVGLQLVTLPILVTALSQKDFGLLQFMQAILLALSIFSLGHVTQGAKRGLVQNKNGTILYAFLYRLRFVIPLAILGIIVSGGLWWKGDATLGVLTLVSSVFLFFGFLPQVTFSEVFIAKKEFGKYAFWQSSVMCTSQIAAVVVATQTQNVVWVVFSQYLVLGIMCITACVIAFVQHHVFESYKKKEIDYEVVPYGKKLMGAEIVQGIASSLHNFIIGPFFGFANLAIFSVASKLDALFRTTVASLYHVLYSDFAKSDRKDLEAALKKKIFFLVFGSCIIGGILFGLAVLYITLFLPIEYHRAIWYMLFLSFGIPGVLVQIIFQTALETRLESNNLGRATVYSQTIRIIFVCLGGFFGVSGVCLAIALSSWVGSGLYGYYFLRSK